MGMTEMGINRWDNLQRTAHWARIEGQSNYGAHNLDGRDYYKFLVEKQKNQTLADIAMRESIKKNYESYSNATMSLPNKKLLESFPGNKNLANMIKNNEKTNYPNTRKLRTTLINNDRFSLNKVTPKMTSKFEKLIIKLKSFI